jgi:SAM-dependent methyltransferase
LPKEGDELQRNSEVAAPTGFVERKFVERFNELIAKGAGELALDMLIQSLPTLASSRMNRKEKLNHLHFMSFLVQDQGIGKHGCKKLLRKIVAVDENIRGIEIPANSTFLDFGCGVHDPIAAGCYYYLNGFSRSVASDLQNPRNPVYSAVSMYEILADVALFTDRYVRAGCDRRMFAERFLELPAGDFATGEFERALQRLAGRVDLRVGPLLDLDIADDELGLVISFAVLERIEDLVGVMQWLFRKSRPGAAQYHFIDMADPRSYAPGSAFHSWSFLTEDASPNGMNRLRKSDYIRSIEDAGFEIVAVKAQESDIPHAVFRKLLPEWRDMSEEDLRTLKLHLTLRRPA